MACVEATGKFMVRYLCRYLCNSSNEEVSFLTCGCTSTAWTLFLTTREGTGLDYSALGFEIADDVLM